MNANFSKYLKILLSVFLLVAILLSFSSNNDFFSSFTNKGLAAKVGSTKITEDELSTSIQSAKDDFFSQESGGFEKLNEKEKLQFKKMIFDNLIKEKLIINLIKDLKMEVSDEVVANQIKQTNFFIDEKTGVFDKTKFNEVLSRYGKSEKDYIDSMKEGLASYGLFVALNLHAKVDLPIRNELIAQSLFRTRTIDLIGIDGSLLPTINPTDEEVQKFYDSNQENFKQSGFRAIKYFILNKNNFLDKITLDENKIKEEIENGINSIQHKELRSVLNIVCNSSEETNQIYEYFNKLNKPDYLNNISDKQKVEDAILTQLKISGCNISEIIDKKVTDIPDEFRAMLFDEINENQMIGNPKTTSVGNQIILLKSIKKLTNKDFENKIRNENKENLAYKMAQETYNKVLQDKNKKFDDLAKEYDMRVNTFDYFDNDGYFKDENSKYILEKLNGFTRTLIENSFKLKNDEISGSESTNGEFIIFALNETHQAIAETIRSLDSVKADITSSLIHDKQNLEADNLLENTFSELKKGTKIEDLQNKYSYLVVKNNMKVNHPDLIKLGGGGNDLDIRIATMIFNNNKKDGDPIKIDNLSKIAIVRNWNEPKDSEYKSNSFLTIISDKIYHDESSELNRDFINHLKNRYEVTIYDGNFK